MTYRSVLRRGRIIIAIVSLTIAATFSLAMRPAQADPPPFIDVPATHTFADEINWLATEGITGGYPVAGGYEYRPSAPALREQLASFLYRMAGSPTVTLPSTSPYLDVTPTHVFYDAIVWLDQQGISTGYTVTGGREFRPSEPVLREQVATFLYRYQGNPPHPTPTTSPFTDVSTSHAFFTQITWLAQNGITTGYTDGTFRPSEPVLREQLAAFLYRVNAL